MSKRWVFGVVLVFLFGAVAGCVGTPKPNVAGSTRTEGAKPIWTAANPILSQPLFKEHVFEHFPVTATDGAKLDNWLWRPKTPDGVKLPTVIHLSPYFGTSLPNGGGSLERMLRENLTSRGYVVMAASVRGTGFSEGCFEIGGPRERQDYNELFAEIAKQPWSNGRVGLIGVSYDGTAPQGALIAGSPVLRTIVPIAAISEWYKYNFVKGVQVMAQGYAFNTYYVADEGAPNFHGLPHVGPLSPGLPNRAPTPQEIQMWPQDAAVAVSRLCPGQGSSNGPTRGGALIDTQRAQVATAFTRTTDPYWEERNFTRSLDKVRPNVSVLVVHGLIDYNVKTHNLLPWITELEKHNVPVKILLGQWGHAYPGSLGNRNGRADWNLTLLRWFDYWLKDLPTGIMDEPRAEIQDYLGVWRQEDTFPPSRAVPIRYHLGPGGLSNSSQTGSGTFIDLGVVPTPASPRPSDSYLVFSTPKLTKEFRYSGEAVANLELSHAAPRGQVAITVYNVTGTSWKPVNWGWHSYNIRNGPDRYDPVVPGERFRLQVPLLPTDMVIPAGSQLAVVLSGIHQGGVNVQPPPSGGQTTVHYGANTNIVFPTLDGITPMDPQPRNLRGAPAAFSSG